MHTLKKPHGQRKKRINSITILKDFTVLCRRGLDFFPESDSEGFYFSGLGGLGGGTERTEPERNRNGTETEPQRNRINGN